MKFTKEEKAMLEKILSIEISYLEEQIENRSADTAYIAELRNSLYQMQGLKIKVMSLKTK